MKTKSVSVPSISSFDTVTVSPTAYPAPVVVTVTLVTVLPAITRDNIAPSPAPFVVVAKSLKAALSVASVTFVEI